MEQPKYARQVLDHLSQSDHGNLAGVHDNFATGLLHPLAADAEEFRCLALWTDEFSQSLNQLCAVKFAGGLASRNQKSHNEIMTGGRVG